MEYFNVSTMESKLQLRICQVCAVDFTVEKFLLPLIDGLNSRNYSVTIVCSNGEIVTKLKNDGYNFITTEISRSLNILKAAKTFLNLYKIFKSEKFDIIHFHTPLASFIGRLAALLSCNSKIIYTAHGFYFHNNMTPLKKNIFIFLEKIASIKNNFIFCQSYEDYLDALKFNFIDQNKILCIGNGVNIDKFNPANFPNKDIIRTNLNIPHDSIIIGIIARLVKEKGYIEFFESAKTISLKYKNVYFLIIGDRLSSDHNESVYENLLETKKSIKDNLIFLGFRNDTPELISIMDIFCLPSHREGLPRTIIEAMMMGKAVVASDIRGCREEVIHNETGLLFESGSSKSLTHALEFLVLNKNITLKMGEKGRERALLLYDEKIIVDKQINVINNILKK